MTTKEVSIEEYLQMEESEKIAFYKQVWIDQKNSNNKQMCERTFVTYVPVRKLKKPIPIYYKPKNSRLTYIASLKNEQDTKHFYVLCLCDCGNWYITRQDAFTKGNTNGGCYSCGCLNVESYMKLFHSPELNEAKSKGQIDRYKLEGRHIAPGATINNWYIVSDIIKNNRKYIKAICPECKKETDYRRADQLLSVNHCGCLTNISHQALRIKNLLIQNNINFVQEKTFDNCVNVETGRHFKYDFYVDNKYIIEVDGSQHFFEDDYYTHPHTREYDEFKNNYCWTNNIPLIRIPYTLREITIEDLTISDQNKNIIRSQDEWETYIMNNQ